MKFNLCCSIAFVIIFLTIISVECAKPGKSKKALKCSNLLEMDRLLAKLYTYGNSGRPFPETLDQFKSYCNETQVISTRFESYFSQCVDDSFTRRMLQIMIHTIRRESRINCRLAPNDPKQVRKQTKLIESALCTNSVKREHQKCLNQAIYYIHDSIPIKESKKKLAFICCNMNKLEECLFERMIKTGPPRCTEERASTSIEFLSSVQGNLINFLCSEFSPESDVCNKYRVDKPTTKKSQYRSFAFPLIDSLASFDG